MLKWPSMLLKLVSSVEIFPLTPIPPFNWESQTRSSGSASPPMGGRGGICLSSSLLTFLSEANCNLCFPKTIVPELPVVTGATCVVYTDNVRLHIRISAWRIWQRRLWFLADNNVSNWRSGYVGFFFVYCMFVWKCRLLEKRCLPVIKV